MVCLPLDKYAPFGKYLQMSLHTSEPPNFTCGLDASLKILGGKWKPLIIYFLINSPRRYGELKRAVKKVSDKVLIQQLKELEAHGVVLREDFGEIPPRVEYSLTPFGLGLAEALSPLCQWGEANAAQIGHVCALAEDR